MAMWNPWRGCKKCSDGCLHCYIHKGDAKRNVDTNKIVKTKDFDKPVQSLKNGNYKMKSGMVYVCFSSDFLVEEADAWRDECWKMIKERQDCTFLFLSKRIDRFMQCIPDDWSDGYDNVVVCCTVENQKNADYKLNIFKNLPIKHKCITAQPLLENIDIEKYLDDIELVIVGGESDRNARVLNYDWVLNIREQCVRKNVSFEFRQCGTYFIKDGKKYTLQTKDLCRQAKLANIDFKKVQRRRIMKNAVEKTKVLLLGWCCDELKEAAQNWLDSIGTDKQKEAGEKYVAELQDSIVPVDGMLAFLPTDEAKAKFGEETANKFYEHAKDLKAQGIANCDCPACTAALAVLELKDEILK